MGGRDARRRLVKFGVSRGNRRLGWRAVKPGRRSGGTGLSQPGRRPGFPRLRGPSRSRLAPTSERGVPLENEMCLAVDELNECERLIRHL
jgi:hypothetical protein